MQSRYRFPALPALALLLLSAGCATTPYTVGRPDPASPPTQTRDAGTGRLVARAALNVLGTPYRYGGNTPDGFDCSGLVHYAYAQNGIAVPRTTRTQFEIAADTQNLQVGDLLFFRIAGRVAHVGIYLGEGRFVHAPSAGKQVSITRLDDPYFRHRLVRSGRLHN